LGASAFYARAAQLGGRPSRWSVGAGTRSDFADVALDHQRQRTRIGSVGDAAVRQSSIYGWGSEEIELSDRVRVQVGLRGDLFRFEVRDRLSPAGSGVRWRGIVSPKANLAMRLATATTAYLNVAGGFHSNDARDVIAAGVGDRVLPRAIGAELGLRHAWHGGTVALAAWRLDLESELIYIGDEGSTEASGATRRVGVDVEGRVRVAPWLWADVDLNLSRGRFRGAPAGADRIPLAPSLTAVAGLTVRDLGPVSGGVRLRAVGSRPASEDGSVTARGYAIWELFGRWEVSRFEFVATVDNLFNTAWNEAQFATTSRLVGDPAPVTELHFTPGSPRAIQLGLQYRF
ncbi:MAG: TonB-dependent receptor domain-containing protein, partial [Gemmatimonadales bacterium]